MALPILDGNQSATTLSTILSSGQHIPAHTVVSLGTQAITDMRSAVSGSVVSISNFPATQTIAGTVTANVFGKESFGNTFVPIQIGASGENFTNGNRIGVALINDAGTEHGTTGTPLNITGTVTANLFAYDFASAQVKMLEVSDSGTGLIIAGSTNANDNPVIISGTVTIGSALPAGTNRIGVVTIGGGTVTIGAGTAQIGSVTASISNFPATQTIAGTVTANAGQVVVDQGGDPVDPSNPFPIFGTVDITALPAGTNRIGVVTIGAGTVTLGAGTAQIGSVTASISGTVPISISSVTVGNSVTIGSLPAISGTVTAMAGTNFSDEIYQGILTYANSEGGDGSVPLQVNIGTLPAISGTVTANTFALQGTAVTTSNFTSTTASTVLANYNATREVLTIFNEGAGNLHICAGATCTTIAYQVRLSAGDYYEVPNHQTTITHSAVFATAGTARVTEVS